MTRFSTIVRSIAAAAIIASMSIWVTVPDVQARKYERNGIYAVGGNKFIIRVKRHAGYLYLRAYRLAGDQWERYGRATIPLSELKRREARARAGGRSGGVERIYFTGKLLGYSTVDLDNPLNTDLNRRSRHCYWC